jgi:hypothetical protein
VSADRGIIVPLKSKGIAMAWELIVGIIMLAVTAIAFWNFLPRKGQIHPWVARPSLESWISLGLITGLAFGGALLLTGILPG